MLKFYDKRRSILKVDPSPKLLENSSLCPFLESNLSTIARPRPCPPVSLFLLWSALKNLVVILCKSFWEIPMPSSLNIIDILLFSFFVVTYTFFPVGVYFKALDRRLFKIKSKSFAVKSKSLRTLEFRTYCLNSLPQKQIPHQHLFHSAAKLNQLRWGLLTSE